MKNTVIRTVLWVLAVLWMGVIFSFSAENAEESLETSDGIVDRVIDHLFEDKKESLPSAKYDNFKMKVSYFVRKTAHFTAYMILGVLILSALFTHKLKNRMRIFLTLTISFLYAVSDEVHQVFVPGRAGRFSDVMIDTSGAVLGILLCLGTFYIIRRFKNKKSLT